MESSTKVAHDISNLGIIRTQDIEISENVDFEGMLLSQSVLNGLKNSGFLKPSPIQLKSIPLGRCGLDLIVQAKAGTGKTCVFTVVALEGLQVESSATQVLVLAPTREIAFQIWQVIMSIGSGIEGLTCATFIGGISVKDDKENLKHCQIAVGTPGRIKFLIEGKYLKTKSIRLLVLDEADQLLDECFQADINWIYSVLPENKQILALSATYPESMAKHLLKYMRNPTYIRLDVTQLALLGIKQYYLKIPFHPHVQKAAEYSFDAAIKILSSISFNQCLIFSNLQSGAMSLAYKLEEQGWPTCCIAGSLEQKDRIEAMASLKAFQCRVLISTDLTSRGIDAENVNLVINLDLPRKPRVYLHRIGRAGRYGSQGAAITLVSGDGGMKMLKRVQTACNTTLQVLPDPIPNDLVSRPCPKACIKLDDIVHMEILSTSQISKEKPSAKKSTMKSESAATGESVCDDSSPQKLRDFSETISMSESPKLENSDISIKNTETRQSDYETRKSLEPETGKPLESETKNSLVSETRKSMDSVTKEPQSFHRPNLPLVNQISVSPWKPTEVPQFKQVPSPGSYSDLLSEFEQLTFQDEKEECKSFESVLPLPVSSEFSLKGEVCKTLDAYYKKVCNTLLGGFTEEKPFKKVNEKDLTVSYKAESQQLIEQKPLKTDPGSSEKKVSLKPETKQNQTELKQDPSVSKKEKYRHLFRCDDEEYFVPDCLLNLSRDEILQSESSGSQTTNKKAPQKSLPRQEQEKEKILVDKDCIKKTNAATEDRNGENLRDKTRSPSLTSGNRKHPRKHPEDNTLKDESSSDSEEYSDSSVSSTLADSSSSYSDSDTYSDSSSEEEEERMDHHYPMLYPQYPYPYSWAQGYPVMAPMNFNPYWTYPNYYGYSLPYMQPGIDPKVTSHQFSTMKSVSQHYFQQQHNYIKWMTKYYLPQKQ